MHNLYFFLLIIFTIPTVYATELSVTLLEPGIYETIILDDNTSLDLTDIIQPIDTPKIIDNTNIVLTQQVQLVANTPGNSIILTNTELDTVSVSIPDNTKISGSASWDKQITPPRIVATGGSVPSGFQTPTASIQVGSPDVILVFDEPVTILLEGITGQIAYKLSGTNNWVLIPICLGTYDTPTNPPEPEECSINNGVDTKIITFHFTEFGPLTETPATPSIPSIPSTSSGNSGGHGRTGVGPSSGSGKYYSPSTQLEIIKQQVTNPPNMPDWFHDVSIWQAQNKISQEEYLNAYQWLVENLGKN